MISISKRSALSLAFIFLLAIPQGAVAKQSDDNFKQGVIYALSACGAVVGGIASYKFLSWLFTKTNQQLLEQAEDSLHRISATYAQMINLYQLADTTRKEYLAEAALYSLARERAGQHDITLYLDYMNKALAILKADLKEISSRLHKAEKKGKHIECYAQMKVTASEISNYILQLTALYETMNAHRAYFVLHDLYAECTLRHGAVAQVFNYSYNSAKDFEYALKTAVMAYDYRRAEKYPYMRYVELLKHDGTQLDRALSGCAYAYHDLLAASKSLRDVLERAKQALVITKEYEQNVRDYERAQREQRMLEEQRRQTEALQRQAQAQERQAYEVARQNRLKEKELQLQREKEQDSWAARFSFWFES